MERYKLSYTSTRINCNSRHYYLKFPYIHRAYYEFTCDCSPFILISETSILLYRIRYDRQPYNLNFYFSILEAFELYSNAKYFSIFCNFVPYNHSLQVCCVDTIALTGSIDIQILDDTSHIYKTVRCVPRSQRKLISYSGEIHDYAFTTIFQSE